ncbi:hypothetical protein Tco_1416225 [Tanacetum coccineum]
MSLSLAKNVIVAGADNRPLMLDKTQYSSWASLIVPSFLPTDDPIASLNKAMAFISTAFTSRYPPTNNQLQTSSNLRNQATIQDGRSQEVSTLTTFQPDDLDAFVSNCDEAPFASIVLMAKLSSYDLKVLSEVPIHDNYLDNHMIDQNVQEIQYSKQPVFNNETDIDITSDSNTISYEQYPKEIENVVVQDTSTSVQ